MRIGIDIDDTITNTSILIDSLIKKHSVKSLEGDYYNYTIEELEKYEDIVKEHIEEVLTNCSVKENASKVIKYLKDKGNTIYLITARSHRFSPNVYNITLKFLEDNDIIYDELLFGYETKKDICIEKKIDIMIDDNVKVYESLIDTRVKPLLFTTSKNKNLDYVRADDWNDIKDIIDRV